jgi:hypothetical protein
MVGEKTIAFSAADYDQLVAVVRDMVNDLGGNDAGARYSTNGSCDTFASADDGRWLLQPDGQAWQPAADVVEAGKAFGNVLGAHAAALLSQLEALFDGLCSARAIFSRVDDLAACSAESFASGHPQLRLGDERLGGLR